MAKGMTIYEVATLLFEEFDFECVIRCKDCKNYGTKWCMGRESFYGLKDDDYCSYGERGEENGN